MVHRSPLLEITTELRICVAGQDVLLAIKTRIQEAQSLLSHVTGLMPSVSIRGNYEEYIGYVSGRLLCQLRIRRCAESHDPGGCLSAGLDAEGGSERKGRID